MTAKIGQPMAEPAGPAARFPQLGAEPAPEATGFAALLDAFRNASDFLGEAPGGPSPADEASANIFNADGFFTRLQTVLAERRADEAPGPFPACREPGPRASLPPQAGNEDHGPAVLPASDRNHVAQRPAPAAASSAGPAALKTARPIAATHSVIARPAIANSVAGDISPAASQPDRPASKAAQDPVRLWVEQGAVHIAGPLGSLSPEDEVELIERVADLLLSHGIGLAGLTLNGRALARPSQGNK